jgi:small subunit ribosomal protein S5
LFPKSGLPTINVIGVDEDRETRLLELRNKMGKFKRSVLSQLDRGFTHGTINGKRMGPPKSYDDVNFDEFETHVIEFRTIMQSKPKGKKKLITCFSITGNGKGIIGYGTGKGSNGPSALKLSKLHASQRLLQIDFYEDRTLFHNFYEDFCFTKLYAEKKAKGYGIKCHRIIKKICQLVGIKDIYVKSEGSHNSQNMVKAFINGLLNQKKYKDIANDNSLSLVEFKKEKHDIPIVLARPDEKREETIQEKIAREEAGRDLNLYLFNNKVRHPTKKRPAFYANTKEYKKYLELKRIVIYLLIYFSIFLINKFISKHNNKGIRSKKSKTNSTHHIKG